MRFLIDANLPHSITDLFHPPGHDVVHVRGIGLGDAPDEDVAARARQDQRCLVTRDYGFADIRAYPPRDYYGIVVLDVPNTTTAPFLRELIGRFLQQSDVVSQLRGRLAIVTFDRIRLRQ